MTFIADETSVYQSRPIELFAFEAPQQSFYLTSFNRDVVAPLWSNLGVNVTYIATKNLGRTSLPVVQVGGNNDVSVEIPYEHPLAQLVIAGMRVAPRYCLCTILRQQAVSGAVQRYWQGYITAVSPNGRAANMRVGNLLMDALDYDLPQAALSKNCVNVLYDSNCRVDRASFSLSSTHVAHSGNQLTVSTLGSPSNTGWWTEGEVLHVATGERRTIRGISGAFSSKILVLEAPFPDAVWVAGTALTLYAGCDHTWLGVNGCNFKFANRKNYVGHPHLDTRNPWANGLTALF